MGFNENLLGVIQSKLGTITTALSLDITFDGEVAFYNYDWIKKQFNKDITPFALTLESSVPLNEGKSIITNQYAIGFVCKESRRSDYNDIFEALYNDLVNYSFTEDGYTYYIRPTGKQSSVPFNEGSGKAEKRFEELINIEVVIVSSDLVSGKYVEIQWNGSKINARSFKILNGISSYAFTNAKPYADAKNLNVNKATFVVECFVGGSIIPFLQINTNANIVKQLFIAFTDDNGGEAIIYEDNASYDGYELSGEYNGVLTAFLYFTSKTISGNPSAFTIDGLAFPIIDYSISIKNITKQIITPNSNMLKEVYLGKARAYVVNVLKTDITGMTTLYNKLIKALMSNGEVLTDNFFNLTITFNGVGNSFTKQVALIEMSDSSENKGVWKITFSEGELL